MTKIESSTRKTGSRRVYLALAIATLLLAMLLLVSPVQAYIAQRSQLAKTNSEISALKQQQVTLQSQISQLHNPNELAYLAKTELNMVYPGEKSYLNPK